MVAVHAVMIGIMQPRLFTVELAPCGVIVRGVASLHSHNFTSFSFTTSIEQAHSHKQAGH